MNETKEIVIEENIALQNAIEKVNKTVVGIRTTLKSGIILEGSGLVLTSDGLALTFSDLVPQEATTSLFLENREYKVGEKVRILKRDAKNNLVLVKIEETNLPTTGFADLNQIKIGERVFLVGQIFDKGIPQKMTNEGIIKTFDENSIKTNMTEKYTLSGSPLFDIEGNVLGLNTIDKDGKVVAIPTAKIKSFSGF